MRWLDQFSKTGEVLFYKLNKITKKHRVLTLLLELAFLFGMFWLTTSQNLDPDFGWHLQAGNYIRVFGIPSHDIFSYFARNFRWIDHEWGSDVLISSLFGHIGYQGVAIFYSVIWTSALYINGRRRFVVMFLASLALQPYVGVRPMVWTVVGLAILLRITESKKLGRKLLVIVPLLFLIWANLHGGFIIGLAYIGYLFIKERKPLWLIILVLSTLATFVNPYGPRLYIEIISTMLDGSVRWQISEWYPFVIFWQSQAYVAIWVAGFWIFSRKQLKEWLSFPFLLFLAGVSSTRNFLT